MTDTIESLRAERDHLKQQAKIHADEARGANDTIYKIYQAVTGATGEPGNWNGAKPVIDALTALRAERDAGDEFKILDVSAGNRAVWFNKKHPLATYLDIRPEVRPDIIADSRKLPPEVGTGFDLVVFDPPHKNNGPNFGMAKTYGCFDHDHIRSTIALTAKEAHRVCKPVALMAFKWNDHSIKLTKVVGLLEPYWEPLFGHGVSHQQRSSSTSWVLLRRRKIGEAPSSLALNDSFGGSK